MKNDTRLSLAFGFIALYILSIPLGTMLIFKLLGNNLQLPEIVYLPLLAYTLLNLRRSILSKLHWNLLDTAVILYLASVALSWIVNRTLNAFGEVAAAGYLTSLYFVLRYWQVYKGEYQTKVCIEPTRTLIGYISLFILDIQKVILYTGYIAFTTGIIGYFLAYFGIYDLVRLDYYYPFLGEVYRTKGFFGNPIFFVTHVGCVLIMQAAFQFSQRKALVGSTLLPNLRSRGVWWCVALVFVLMLTKIKSLLSLFGILCLLFAWFTPKRGLKYSSAALGSMGIIAYLFFSHWLVLDRNDPNFEAKLHTAYYSQNHTWTPIGKYYALIPTFYTVRKESAYTIGKRAFPWGIGGNELCNAKDSLWEARGMDTMIGAAPHSTYWGVFAELGLLGMIAIFALLWASLQAIYTKFDSALRPYYLAILFFLCLEAFTVDLMNVRLIWVLLSLLSGLSLRKIPPLDNSKLLNSE